MNLMNVLTDEDKTLIKEYTESYCGVEKIDTNIFLKEWSRNKQTLYKALGNNLRVKVPVQVEVSQSMLNQRLREIFVPLDVYKALDSDFNTYYSCCNFTKEFQKSLYEKINQIKDEAYDKEVYNYICRHLMKTLNFYIFNYSIIQEGKTYLELNKDLLLEDVFSIIHNFVDIPNREKIISLVYDICKPFKIPCGTKIIKAIKKILIAFDLDKNEILSNEFEKFRNDLSNVTTVFSKLKTNVIFSIHPIDLITLSDNNCDWQSCFNWRHNGGYSGGVIELLNSNNILCVYLESNAKKFMFFEHEIPNKSWRCLMVCTKDIIVCGKPYPYSHEDLQKKVVETLRTLVYKNVKWKYQYGVQQYKDMIGHPNANHFLREKDSRLNHDLHYRPTTKLNPVNKKHSIYFYTRDAYNDMLEDQDTRYWCVRNWVPQTKIISVSGKHTCVICGKNIYSHENDNIFHMEYGTKHSEKICRECKKKYACEECEHLYNDDDKIETINILCKAFADEEKSYRKIPRKICKTCLKTNYRYDENADAYISYKELERIKNIVTQPNWEKEVYHYWKESEKRFFKYIATQMNFIVRSPDETKAISWPF